MKFSAGAKLLGVGAAVPATIVTNADLEKLAFQNPAIKAELGDSKAQKVITRAPKLVNIVI